MILKLLTPEQFTLFIAIMSLIVGLIMGYNTPWRAHVSKNDLKRFSEFECNDPLHCGNGGLCNSCYTRKWAIEKLNELD